MFLLRYLLKKKGMRSKEIDILMASWKTSTIKAYNSYIKKYIEFCETKNYNFLTRKVNRIIKFLTMLYENECSYSAINIARSALSCIFHDPPIGEHFLISRLLKGIFNLRPSRPRYSKVWNVNKVLSFLEKWTPSRSLDLKQLTLKTLMLIMLTSGQRCQTIHALNLKQVEISRNHIHFHIDKNLKHNKINNMENTVIFNSFVENKKICPVTYIKEYIKRTKKLRTEDQFFISFKTFRAVNKETLSSWIKLTLSLAGIDTSLYKAHSTRAASTSAAFLKTDINTIMKAASWKNSQTFAKFYNKPIEEESFCNAVLKNKL